MTNSDPTLNGEALFFNNFVKHNSRVVFDIGCNKNTIFREYDGEVHYFNPLKDLLKSISKHKTKNTRSVFNRFGLANIDGELPFFTEYNSFVDHYKSNDTFPSDSSKLLPVHTGQHYMIQHNLEKVDFVKISANGLDFDVIRGFGDFLIDRVHIIQFHYSKSFFDADVKLMHVIQYLHKLGFYNFSYLTPTGLCDVSVLNDTYEDCNIVCLNKNFQR